MSRVPYHELKARERVAAICDPGSFKEILPPPERVMSVYLPELDIPVSFDDGLVIGRASLNGSPVYLAAQVGQFVGGSVGEVHSAKLVGLIESAARDKIPFVMLIESGGVRLHEGSSGEIGIAESMRAVFECRTLGIATIAVIGSDIGAYGGMGIFSACCGSRVMTEHGRLGVSGPIVIEKWMGKQAFDSSDRALIWKTSGGKTRYLLGDADVLVDDSTDAVRAGIISLLGHPVPVTLESVSADQQRLESRLAQFGKTTNPDDIWTASGVTDIAAASLASGSEFANSYPKKSSAQ